MFVGYNSFCRSTPEISCLCSTAPIFFILQVTQLGLVSYPPLSKYSQFSQSIPQCSLIYLVSPYLSALNTDFLRSYSFCFLTDAKNNNRGAFVRHLLFWHFRNTLIFIVKKFSEQVHASLDRSIGRFRVFL